ncbi:peptidoglycan-binding protein [Aestuariimicrobium soli]|uniref:peptidoglycan-binding protein n=1 Tax=Aestuariimicrobium soli TaxID=2035834 RepID=UPI003EBB5FBF
MKRIATVMLALFAALLMLGSSPVQAEAVTFKSWPVLKSGATGTQVTSLQYLLTGRGAATTADGSYGPLTVSAVKKFQSSKGLTADGVTGPNTWSALTTVNVRSGNTGSLVKAVQVQLRRNGHSVAVDGSFGPATLSAVKAFQKAKGLSVDGVVGPNTWRAMIAGVSTGTTTTRAAAARAMLNDTGITLLHFCGPAVASPRQNILDTANGGQASTGGGDVGYRRVWLNTSMLVAMRDFGVGHSYRVTAIAGCDHSSTSWHYTGNAIDVDLIDGVKVSTTTSGRNAAAKLKSFCAARGATQILGPGDAGHSGHVHCGWK